MRSELGTAKKNRSPLNLTYEPGASALEARRRTLARYPRDVDQRRRPAATSFDCAITKANAFAALS